MRHTLSLAATRVFPSDDILTLLIGTSSSGTYPLSVSVPDMNSERACDVQARVCMYFPPSPISLRNLTDHSLSTLLDLGGSQRH